MSFLQAAPDNRLPTTEPSVSDRIGHVSGRFFAIAAIVAIVLRGIQYFARSSLYVDEAALALNVRMRPAASLFDEPLDFAQSAPFGFLLQQKLLMSLVGEHELILRLVPFIAGIAAVPLFIALARRLLSAWSALTVCVLFAFSFHVVYFGAYSKPYMIDLLVAAVALLAGLDLMEDQVTRARIAGYAALGAAIVWFTQGGVLALAALSIVVLWHAWANRRENFLALLGMSGVWGFSGVIASLLSLRTLNANGRAYIRDFWAGGFMPLPPRSLEDFAWFPARILDIGADPLGSLMPGAAVVLLGLGAFGLPRLGRWRALLVAMPVLVTLGASAAGQYPFGNSFGLFSGRVVLFLVPSLLIIIGAGIEFSATFLRGRSLPVMIAVLVLGNVAPFVVSFPIPRGEIRPVLEHVARTRSPSDHVYVYYGARHVYEWYAASLGLRSAPNTLGVCARWNPALYLSDLDRIPAGRVWVVITHIVRNEPALILSYLRANADEMMRVDAPGASAFLFQVEESSFPGHSPIDPTTSRMPSEYEPLGCRGFYEWPRNLARSQAAYDRIGKPLETP